MSFHIFEINKQINVKLYLVDDKKKHNQHD